MAITAYCLFVMYSLILWHTMVLCRWICNPQDTTVFLMFFLPTNHYQFLYNYSVNVLPGINNHEAVLVKFDMSVKNSPNIKRKSYLWGKADFSTINHLIADFTTTFVNHPIDTPVQLLWDSYKALCIDCLQLVPTKLASSSNSNQPWATPLIRQLSREGSNAYIIMPN